MSDDRNVKHGVKEGGGGDVVSFGNNLKLRTRLTIKPYYYKYIP